MRNLDEAINVNWNFKIHNSFLIFKRHSKLALICSKDFIFDMETQRDDLHPTPKGIPITTGCENIETQISQS